MTLAIDKETLVDRIDRRWWHHAACKDKPAFTVDPAHGPVNLARAQARHICMAHCPVLRQCLNDAMENPPNGVVQGGLVWENWGTAKPLREQPDDPGCGPWCREFRGIPNKTGWAPEGDTLGTRILTLRMAHGWSSTELAQRAGVSQTSISRLERGVRLGQRRRRNGANGTVIGAIAEALGVTEDELRGVKSS